MARLIALSSAANMEPSPIWAWMTRNIWSRSFYVAPVSISVLIIIVLCMTRPKELDLRTFIIAWCLSTPVGFLLWVYGWKTFGAGNGHITATVGTTAMLGWCTWHRGLYVAWIERKFRRGLTLCILSGIVTLSVKTIIGSSTGPIKLAMTAAVIGAAFPLCLLLAVKVNAWQRRFVARFVTATWRFLNQPIALGHVTAFPAFFRSGAAEQGEARTSRDG